MTILEKKSERKKKAIMLLVQTGEMSVGNAMYEAEKLNDEGKLLDKDYEELAEWLESLMPVETEETEQLDTEVDSTEQIEETEESTEEAE